MFLKFSFIKSLIWLQIFFVFYQEVYSHLNSTLLCLYMADLSIFVFIYRNTLTFDFSFLLLNLLSVNQLVITLGHNLCRLLSFLCFLCLSLFSRNFYLVIIYHVPILITKHSQYLLINSFLLTLMFHYFCCSYNLLYFSLLLL